MFFKKPDHVERQGEQRPFLKLIGGEKMTNVLAYQHVVEGFSVGPWGHIHDTVLEQKQCYFCCIELRLILTLSMDKLQLTGRNLSRVFNSRLGCAVRQGDLT